MNYIVAPNSGGLRSGTITVAGPSCDITQQGFSCVETISPSFAYPTDIGNTYAVSVSAPPGCAWTAVSNVPWLTVQSGGSGNGGGVVRVKVAQNTGGIRSGTVTIAGNTYSVTQGAGACGALDVTSQYSVNLGGFVWESPTLLWEDLVVRGPAPLGPLYLVLLGQPNHQPPPNDTFLYGVSTLTTCFSSQGDYILPIPNTTATPTGASIPVLWGLGAGGFLFNTHTKCSVECLHTNTNEDRHA